MPQVFLRHITPGRRAYLDTARFVREGMRIIEKEIIPPMLADFDSTVQTWQTRVVFQVNSFVFTDRISVQVTPAGPGAQLWQWTEKGTRPHIILPRGPRPLRFAIGGMPKTRPGRIHATGGRRGRFWRSARLVHHPGTKPRKFTQQIARKHRSMFRRIMENFIRQHVRAARGP